MATDAAAVDSVDTGNLSSEWVYTQINGDLTELARAYFTFEKEGIFDKLYWRLPIDATNTLAKFVSMYEYYSSAGIYKVYSNRTGEIFGYFTFQDVVLPHQCVMGCMVRRRFWGDLTEEVGRAVLAKVHETTGIKRIYAFTPWRTGMSFCEERLGMKHAGSIKNYAQGRDVHVYVHEE